MERVGERRVLPCRDFYRHQRLRDVVETPSVRRGGHCSSGAKIKLPVWWAMALPLLLIALLFPTALLAIAVIWLLDTLLLSRIPVLRKWFK